MAEEAYGERAGLNSGYNYTPGLAYSNFMREFRKMLDAKNQKIADDAEAEREKGEKKAKRLNTATQLYGAYSSIGKAYDATQQKKVLQILDQMDGRYKYSPEYLEKSFLTQDYTKSIDRLELQEGKVYDETIDLGIVREPGYETFTEKHLDPIANKLSEIGETEIISPVEQIKGPEAITTEPLTTEKLNQDYYSGVKTEDLSDEEWKSHIENMTDQEFEDYKQTTHMESMTPDQKAQYMQEEVVVEADKLEVEKEIDGIPAEEADGITLSEAWTMASTAKSAYDLVTEWDLEDGVYNELRGSTEVLKGAQKLGALGSGAVAAGVGKALPWVSVGLDTYDTIANWDLTDGRGIESWEDEGQGVLKIAGGTMMATGYLAPVGAVLYAVGSVWDWLT